MHFLKHEFDAEEGDVLEVDVQAEPRGANVVLLDNENFAGYVSNSPSFQYVGGFLDTDKPVRLRVPRAGHWFLVVDLGGRGGRMSAAVRLIKRATETVA